MVLLPVLVTSLFLVQVATAGAGRDAVREETVAKEVVGKDVAAEEAPGTDTSENDVPAEQAPAEGASAEQASAEGASTGETRYQTFLDFRSLVKGGTVRPRWMADGSRFWYAEGEPANAAIHVIDPVANTKEPLFDTERLRRALAAVLGHEPAHRGLPFAEFSFGEAEQSVTFTVEDRIFHLDMETYEVTERPRPTDTEKARTSPAEGEVPSPDGRRFALIDDHDLWIRFAEDGRRVRLTTDGEPDFGWSVEGASWSSSGYLIALQKSDERAVHKMPVVHWLGPEEEVEWVSYTFTGGPLPGSEIYIVDVSGKRSVRVDAGEDPEQFFHLLGWRQGDTELLFMRLDRAMRRLDLMAADPVTGTTRIILTERQKTFIEGLYFAYIADNIHTPLGDGERFIWRSERDGWAHFYLYGYDGTLESRLTAGRFPVHRVVAVDLQGEWVYFIAPGDPAHPYDRHLYRVDLRGKRMVRLTDGAGWHRVMINPARTFFVDNHSSFDRPPMAELRGADGTLVRTLATADVSALKDLDWQPPEEFTAKAADGATDLFGLLYRPPAFDPARKYPVIEIIYAGCQVPAVPRTFIPNEYGHIAQALAQLGFVTVVIDARGTSGRGKAFQDVVYRNIGRHEIPDHVAVLRQLAEARPYLDMDRVGVHGKSWGGYFVLRAMLLAPDVYHVGVASALVAELESVAYGPVEPYMGRPRDNPDGYAYASNLNIADALQGKLLITTGTADVNTPFAHTMRMVEAFIRAGKPVDLLVLPDQHHWPEGASQRYLFDAVKRYFVEHLQPAG
jgi:dipeptidyl aminopeptidase/acylaminoacyl peptidase